MTKAKSGDDEAPDTQEEVPAVEPTEPNASPNPPTTPVEGNETVEDAQGTESAPVYEGGDPGTAVESADDKNPDYYHPVLEVAPEAETVDDDAPVVDDDDAPVADDDTPDDDDAPVVDDAEEAEATDDEAADDATDDES